MIPRTGRLTNNLKTEEIKIRATKQDKELLKGWCKTLNQTQYQAELADITGKSVRTVSRKLSQLVELGVVRINGNKYSKNHTYSLNEK